MRALICRLIMLPLACWSGATVAAAGDRNWLMTVLSRPTDATRDAEFNAWYDDVDIPEVLEVPGYERARRGRRMGLASSLSAAAGESSYVAWYDIVTGNIDRLMVDMLMSARKMSASGRSTNLLEVTEVAYYRAGAVLGRGKYTGDAQYVFAERAGCEDAQVEQGGFRQWYGTVHVRQLRRIPSVSRVRRYELYRALTAESPVAPHYLTLYEISVSSDEQVADTASAIISSWTTQAPAPDGRCGLASSSRLYRIIKDVQSAPAAAGRVK